MTASDRAWIQSHESETLAQIETATLRFVAMRLHGITRAAEVLGLSHSTLSEWVARRTLDISIDGGTDDDDNDNYNDNDDDDDDDEQQAVG